MRHELTRMIRPAMLPDEPECLKFNCDTDHPYSFQYKTDMSRYDPD